MTAGVDEAFQARRVSASQMRLTASHPFFAALMMMAPIRMTESVGTAATDGESLFFNPAFIAPLTAAELDGLIVHEVLHCALMHVPRRRGRDCLLWNIAADIHVNGLIRREAHLKLPAGAVIDDALEHLSVEEIYEVLRSRDSRPEIALLDLAPVAGRAGERSEASDVALEAHWRSAISRAIAASSLASHGKIPAGILREFRAACEPRIDWRSQLWRWLVRTPDDFQGFDRRLVWQRVYLEQLEGESLRAEVCIDTSGSVSDEQLDAFLGEVRGILRSYPAVRCRLWYADAQCHGPFDIDHSGRVPKPIGGGGTDFRPFLERTAADLDGGALGHAPPLLVYLTDGRGTFPDSAPGAPVLWAVIPEGLESSKFPFGTVVRMA
jgi:predicted metal-dependent peptidase